MWNRVYERERKRVYVFTIPIENRSTGKMEKIPFFGVCCAVLYMVDNGFAAIVNAQER